MMQTRISINGKFYDLAPLNGQPHWETRMVPSQWGDGGELRRAEWSVSGPLFNSEEGPDGYLGPDYTDNVDTRYDNYAVMGPKITSVTLSTYDTIAYASVKTIVPTGPGAHTDWTPSASTNVSNVDDPVGVPDDDATYNSSSTASAKDTFAHAATGLAAGTVITKVTVRVRIRKTATGTPTTFYAYVHNEQTYPSAVQTLADNTTYQNFDVDFTTNPATGEAWQVSEVDGVFFGYMFGAGTGCRVTQCYMTVVCAATPNANGMAVQQDSTGVRWLYVIRGRDVVKVRVLDLALQSTVTTVAEEATGILATITPSGAREVAIAMNGTTYHVITTVGTYGTADTASANNESKQYRVLGQGGASRVYGLKGQVVDSNILTASVGMDASGWQNLSTVVGRELVPTGFAQDGDIAVFGYDRGPYYISEFTRELVPLIDEIGPSMDNCRGMTTWSLLGVVIPLQHGLRYFKNGYSASFGPERWTRNNSPVQGFFTAVVGSEKELWGAYFNPTTGDTYLLQGVPRREGDPHSEPVSWYGIATFSGKRCDVLLDLEGLGGRSRPTLVGGYGTNMFYLDKGRTPRWFDDPNVRFHNDVADWYGTRMRRHPELIKDLEAVEYDTDDTYSGGVLANISVSFDVDGATATPLSASAGDGHKRLPFSLAGVPAANSSGRRIKPHVAFAVTGAATATPKLIGPLVLYYRERPEMLPELTFSVKLDNSDPGARAETKEEALQALLEAGPVAVTGGRDGDSGYWRVVKVDVQTQRATGSGAQTGSGDIRIARVTARKWPTAAGE